MPVAKNNRFLLLYGSQTGQAKAIAEEITEKAQTENLFADIHCLSDTEKKFHIEREKCMVIVISSTGDGEPPDTALKFIRRLKNPTLTVDYLSHVHYALLGLGDSNYSTFCNCGKNLDKTLQDLGAKRFYNCGWADDAVGLEVVVEPWMNGLFLALKMFLNLPVSNPKDSIVTMNGTSDRELMTGDRNIRNEQEAITLCDRKDDIIIQNGSLCCDLSNTNTYTNQSNVVVSSDNCIQANLKSNVITRGNSSDKQEPATQTSECLKESEESSTMNIVNTSGDCVHIKSSVMESIIVGGGTVSIYPLSEATLTVPLLPPPYLQIEYQSEQSSDLAVVPLQNGCSFPSAASPVTMATVTSIRTLTAPSSVKKTMLMELDISETAIRYEPGDSFSVICPNEQNEVARLLHRLEVGDKADCPYHLVVIEGTKKRNACVPMYVQQTSTLRQVFTTCLDIREPPKKALLRVMLEYTSDPLEKRRVQELCSKQGAEDYTKFVREPSLSMLDVLNWFPSCRIPVERLIEHLPRLQPRPYSVCSSPLKSVNKIQFVYNVLKLTMEQGRTYERKGLCTGWLESLSQTLDVKQSDILSIDEVTEHMNKLKILNIKIPVFQRTNQNFHLPDDVTVPLILIGPGTGVAPFLGFLDHRCAQRENILNCLFGEIWLLYGCRHKDRDYLFRNELQNHLKTATLSKLLVSFSRDDQPMGAPRYVQDNIRSHGTEIVHLLDNDRAIVYVCGDATNMAKDVNDAFVDVYTKEKGISANEASKIIMKLRLEKRYKEDVWT